MKTHTFVFRQEGIITQHFLLKISPLHFQQLRQVWEEGHTEAESSEIDHLCFVTWYERILNPLIQRDENLLYYGTKSFFNELEIYQDSQFIETNPVSDQVTIQHLNPKHLFSLDNAMYIFWDETFKGEVFCEFTLEQKELNWELLHFTMEEVSFKFKSLNFNANINKGLNYDEIHYPPQLQMFPSKSEDLQINVQIFNVDDTKTPSLKFLFDNDESSTIP